MAPQGSSLRGRLLGPCAAGWLELDCRRPSRGAASPSLSREQQKAQERQELWQGLEELRLRRLQGTQEAKEAPLQRLTPQVAASGGQS